MSENPKPPESVRQACRDISGGGALRKIGHWWSRRYDRPSPTHPQLLNFLQTEHGISATGAEELSLSEVARLVKPRQYVTLNQAAAIVNKSKKALERYRGVMPQPVVKSKGGSGKANLWDWDELRPWLQEKFGLELPEEFPKM